MAYQGMPHLLVGEEDVDRRFRTVDLAPHRNNIGLTVAGNTGPGAFNVWGNSLPAEGAPTGRLVHVEGVPFRFPDAGGGLPDNVRCDGQFVHVPEGAYDWLYVLGAAERRVEEEIACHYADGSIDFEPLRLSDLWAAPAVFGESAAYTSRAMHYPQHVQRDVWGSIWCQRVPLVRRATLTALRLPVDPAVHLFAATLVVGAFGPGASGAEAGAGGAS